MPIPRDMALQTKRDRVRLDRLTQELEGYQPLLAEAGTPVEQERYQRPARAKQQELKTYRIYPFGLRLFGASVLVVLVPWAVLSRNGHKTLGLVAGAATALVVVALHVWRRRRLSSTGE